MTEMSAVDTTIIRHAFVTGIPPTSIQDGCLQSARYNLSSDKRPYLGQGSIAGLHPDRHPLRNLV
jgi:hypothetical protein